MKIKLFIALIFSIFAMSNANAQFDDIYLGIGFSGTNIFEGNVSSVPMMQKNSEKANIIGGSFDGAELGFIIKSEFNLDSACNFFIPVSFEYTWFTAKEIYWSSASSRQYLEHNMDAQRVSIGLNWYFYKFPFQNVRPFIGFDVKGSFFNRQELKNRIEYQHKDSVKYVYFQMKEPAFRLGGELKIGFRGELVKNFFLQGSFGVEVLNLLLRDGERGELLTPIKRYSGVTENEEKSVPNFHFSLIIEYKL